MASYFDEDIISEDNDFETESTDSSVDEKEYINTKKKPIIKTVKVNDTELDSDNDQVDSDLDIDPEEEVGIQFGGVEDFVEEEEGVEEDEDEDDDDDEVENEQLENDNENEIIKKDKKKQLKSIPDTINIQDVDDDLDEDNGENYLKKFDKEINKNYIMNFHPECIMHNYDEVEALTKVVRDKNNIIIDDLHKTIPYLTKYERTRIIGQRAKQINAGATAFVKVPENVIDGYLIAELELKEKRIPFIIRRPLPNGGSEYWNVKDLENIAF
jgi:DNA-directed RNA polymerase subunit K/omega